MTSSRLCPTADAHTSDTKFESTESESNSAAKSSIVGSLSILSPRSFASVYKVMQRADTVARALHASSSSMPALIAHVAALCPTLASDYEMIGGALVEINSA